MMIKMSNVWAKFMNGILFLIDQVVKRWLNILTLQRFGIENCPSIAQLVVQPPPYHHVWDGKKEQAFEHGHSWNILFVSKMIHLFTYGKGG